MVKRIRPWFLTFFMLLPLKDFHVYQLPCLEKQQP